MYPTINRMGNYGSNPISYGPPKGYGKPGGIPGYDLRVSIVNILHLKMRLEIMWMCLVHYSMVISKLHLLFIIDKKLDLFYYQHVCHKINLQIIVHSLKYINYL